MRFKLRAHQILIERKQLTRREHTFIDNDFGREAAGIELFGFGEARVAAQHV